MTKSQYFEMMEQLGSEPIEEEIPVEIDDFPLEIQQVFTIYYKLKDDWDTFNGNYMGKSLLGLQDILEIYGVDKVDRAYILDWISEMDGARHKIFKDQKQQKEQKTSKS